MNPAEKAWKLEPAMVIAVVAAIINVLILVFGVEINDGQKEAILALFGVVLPILFGVVVRSQVTPTAKLPPPAEGYNEPEVPR